MVVVLCLYRQAYALVKWQHRRKFIILIIKFDAQVYIKNWEGGGGGLIHAI